MLQKRIAAFQKRDAVTGALGNGFLRQDRARLARRHPRHRRPPSSPGSPALATWFGMSITALIPGAFALAASPLLAPTSRDQAHAEGARPVVAARRLRADAVDAVEQAALRLLRPPGALHRLHPVGGGLRLRRRVGGEVPHRDGRRAAGPGVLRGYYAGAHTGDYVNQMVNDFSSTVVQLDLGVPGHAVPRQRRRGRVLRRRRWRRRWRGLLVTAMMCTRPGKDPRAC